MLLDEHHECELVAGPKAVDELEVFPGGDDAGGAHDVKGTTGRVVSGSPVTRYNAGMADDREPIALAIDIGGTFTDLAAVDRRDGSLILAKVAKTPSRLQEGVLSALERSGLDPDDVGAFVHRSTVVINAVTERSGARVALVTTEGFRDVLEIGRANRPDLYNLASCSSRRGSGPGSPPS